jgi:hypothetical protein
MRKYSPINTENNINENNNSNINNNNNNINNKSKNSSINLDKNQLNTFSFNDLNFKNDNEYKYIKIKNTNNIKREPYNEFNFESSLRYSIKKKKLKKNNNNYNYKNNSLNNNINNNSTINRKDFINYTSNYGNFFDEKYQYGGESKIPIYKLSKKSFNINKYNSPLKEYLKTHKIEN